MALVPLALVVFLEIITRAVLFPMSLDFQRFASYGERADALQSRAGPRVAFIGNSATEAGVDVDVLKHTLSTRGVPAPTVDLFLADGSAINTWRSMLNHYFWKRGNSPDLVVITFFGSGLDDALDFEIGRLAQFFTQLKDWSELTRIDLLTTGQRADWVLSSVWATYAARDRIRDRVLSLFVPSYKRYVIALHDASGRNIGGTGGVRAPTVTTYRSLKSVLERSREVESRLLFVAYPLRDTRYVVHPEALRLIKDLGATYLDMREHFEPEPSLYLDTHHLTETGKLLYTRRLAEVLAPRLAALGR